MGLDISLISIEKQKTTETEWLAVEDCSELSANYVNYAIDREFDYEGEQAYTRPVYYYREIAYQRKGVKRAFYDRYEPDVFIQTRKELVELEAYILDDYLPTFKKDFVEKFKEGENLICMGY